MFCKQCGQALENETKYCPRCGTPTAAPAAPAAPAPGNPLLSSLLAMMKDKLFLVICILESAVCGLGLLTGSVPVLPVLFTVFLWLLYAKAGKGVVSAKFMRCVSGTVYAEYIVLLVAGILVVVCGLISAMAFLAMDINTNWTYIVQELESIGGSVTVDLPAFILDSAGWIWLLVLFLLVAGTAFTIVSVFLTRKIHGFAKALYLNAQAVVHRPLPIKTVCLCMVISGSLNIASAGLSLLSGQFLACLSPCCMALSMFFGRALILKYLHHK